jgi:aspartate 1-decarboxylase
MEVFAMDLLKRARLVMPGDRVIIAGFALVEADELKDWKPSVVGLDGRNRVVAAR